MRGSVKFQAGQIVENISAIGESKRENKTTPHLRGGLKTSPYIHSYRTQDEVFNRAVDLMRYARECHKVKDAQSIDSEIIKGYIQEKIDLGIKKRSIDTYISQLEKIRSSLDSMPKLIEKHNNLFSRDDLVECKEMAKSATISEHTSRAYGKPQAMINAIENPQSQFIANLQLNYGLRLNEARKIKASQLQGNKLTIRGKGGYFLTKELSKEDTSTLKYLLWQNGGKMEVAERTYRTHLQNACRATKQEFTGSHGLRYNYALTSYNNLLANNVTHEKALEIVSEAMGHHRADITLHYLRD